jgi:hypothetical protein
MLGLVVYFIFGLQLPFWFFNLPSVFTNPVKFLSDEQAY